MFLLGADVGHPSTLLTPPRCPRTIRRQHILNLRKILPSHRSVWAFRVDHDSNTQCTSPQVPSHTDTWQGPVIYTTHLTGLTMGPWLSPCILQSSGQPTFWMASGFEVGPVSSPQPAT